MTPPGILEEKDGIVTKIMVDNKEYSVKGAYKWKEYIETIESFNYGNGAWWFIGKDEKGYTHQLVSELQQQEGGTNLPDDIPNRICFCGYEKRLCMKEPDGHCTLADQKIRDGYVRPNAKHFPPPPSQPGEGHMTPKVAKQFFDAIDKMPLPEQGKEEQKQSDIDTWVQQAAEEFVTELGWGPDFCAEGQDMIKCYKEGFNQNTLKSKPTDGWSDELRNDFAIEFMLWNTPVSVPNRQGKRNEMYTLMQDFIESPSGRQWLSSYKLKQTKP